ncbi:MAG: phage tail protein [Dehalococcoidia bacterium]|nr:phage tail protein [Dehalococcoidia bacterium]
MTGERVDPGTANHFAVSIGGESSAAFSECTGLQLELDIMEYQEGGQNDYVHKLPGRLKQGNITLRRGIIKSDKMWQWVLKTFAGNIERKNVDVALCTADGKQIMLWSLLEACPVKWMGPGLKASDNSIAVDTFELVFKEIRVE